VTPHLQDQQLLQQPLRQQQQQEVGEQPGSSGSGADSSSINRGWRCCCPTRSRL
jgi:hypothetical protein